MHYSSIILLRIWTALLFAVISRYWASRFASRTEVRILNRFPSNGYQNNKSFPRPAAMRCWPLFMQNCTPSTPRCCNTTGDDLHPFDAADIDQRIDDGAEHNQARQVSPLLELAAFEQDNDERSNCTENLPAEHDEGSKLHAVVFICPDLVCREREYPLMQVVGENQQHKQRRRDIEKSCPSRQAEVLRLAEMATNTDSSGILSIGK